VCLSIPNGLAENSRVLSALNVMLPCTDGKSAVMLHTDVRMFSGTDFTTRLPSPMMKVEMKVDADLISTNVHVVQFSR
jgi:hypothetical protein